MTTETLEDKIARAGRCVALLREHYPNARCTLNYTTVHQLLVATILSAQCTDERVNIVTASLFKKYRRIRDFAGANLKILGSDIYSTGFHNNKAKSIKQSAQQLLHWHGGKMPHKLEQLVKLAGVGRKTASVVLGAGFGLAEGIVVDTHVGRISRKLGFTTETYPSNVEVDLMQIIPSDDWIVYSHLLIDHGRAVCKARKPECPDCMLSEQCPLARA